MKTGFTLIELLIVISIIGILATIGLNTFPGAQKNARDQQRKSDLGQYRTALEAYANAHNGVYPGGAADSGGIPATSLCVISDWSLFMSGCPESSLASGDASFQYKYSGDGSASFSIRYVLWGKLESPSTTTFWVLCSSGKSGNATSGIPVTGGGCPI